MTTITMLDQQRTDPLLEKVELLRGRDQRPAEQPKQNDRTPFPRTTRILPARRPITHTAISIRSENGNGGKTRGTTDGRRGRPQMGADGEGAFELVEHEPTPFGIERSTIENRKSTIAI
jgi:hypothetical protein